jgi:hypothetical protein
VGKKTSIEVFDVSQPAWGANEQASGRFGVESVDSNGQTALRIIGWVVGKSSRAMEMEILVGDDVIGRTPVGIRRPDVAKRFPKNPQAATSGFKIILVPQGRGGESELIVRAVLEGGVRVPMGTIRTKVADRGWLSRLRRG